MKLGAGPVAGPAWLGGQGVSFECHHRQPPNIPNLYATLHLAPNHTPCTRENAHLTMHLSSLHLLFQTTPPSPKSYLNTSNALGGIV